MHTAIAFVGAGAIAEALIRGICQTGVASPGQLTVTNKSTPQRRLHLADTYGVRACDTIAAAVGSAEVILICVKPKDVGAALTETAQYARADALYVSVAAGCSITWMTDVIQRGRPHGMAKGAVRLIRTMPNTSCAVLESASAYALGSACSEADGALVERLLGAVGTCHRLEESQLDAVTGLSGTGPAYVYYLVEALTDAGAAAGLNPDIAYALVTQTLIGAAAMIRQTGDGPATLRERVTSPGGTTMAGLAVLRDYEFAEAIGAAVRAATERSAELGQLFTGVNRDAQDDCPADVKNHSLAT